MVDFFRGENLNNEKFLEIPWSLILDGSMFGHIYKLLIVNLSDDTFRVVKDEDENDVSSYSSISQWFSQFASRNKVHPDDISAYTNFTSLEKIKNHFKSTNRYMYVRYRRKTAGKKWKWSTMDIFIYPQEKPDPDKVLLIVRDIDEDYSKELTHQKKIENNCYFDPLSGIHNRLSYISRCRNYYETNQKVGVIFSDLNGLKYTNDRFGHEKGDQLIKEMAKMMISSFRQNECFRIGGDEFVILLGDIEKDNFEFRAKTFIDYIKSRSREFLIASTGYSWCEYGQNLEETIRSAEKMMYENKTAYHDSEEGRFFTR